MAHPLAGTWGKPLISSEGPHKKFVGRLILEMFSGGASDAHELAMIISPARGSGISQDTWIRRVATALSAYVAKHHHLDEKRKGANPLQEHDGDPLISSSTPEHEFIGRTIIEIYTSPGQVSDADGLTFNVSLAQDSGLSQEQFIERIAKALPIRIENDAKAEQQGLGPDVKPLC